MTKKLCLALLAITLAFGAKAAPVNIPLGGNAYITAEKSGARITANGLTKWTNPSTLISTYFKTSQAGEINLSIRAKAPQDGATILVKVGDKSYNVDLKNTNWTIVPVANNIPVKKGYVEVQLQGLSTQNDIFAEVSDLVIDGDITEQPLYYVDDFSYYWGRRGPSVHMGYQLPNDQDFEYFYNEVTVPEGEDVMNSYFMANGFGEGYFGMQTNSENERRILFSVWSPFTTDNPDEIPDDEKIVNLRRGKNVHIGEFGNEGSGGQSYLRYPWKAGNTYKFLSQVRPDGEGNTVYTGYFFAPEENKWILISSFKRPKTDTWYKRPHSFLENFNPEQGYLTRRVEFGNQWARTKEGKWVELNEGLFTHDATGGAKARMDYAGGLDQNNNTFFLENCGFFDESTPYRSTYERKKKGKQPKIDLNKLAKIKE